MRHINPAVFYHLIFLPCKIHKKKEDAWLTITFEKKLIVNNMKDGKLEYEYNLDKDQHTFNKNTLRFGKKSMFFVSDQIAQVFLDFENHVQTDLLLIHLTNYPVLSPYIDKIPQTFVRQVVNLLAIPDFEFGYHFSNVVSSKGMSQRNVLNAMLSILEEFNVMEAFLRHAFSLEIYSLTNNSTIVRDSTPTPSFSSIILRKYGLTLIKKTVDDITKIGSLSECIQKIFELKTVFPPEVNFVLNQLLRASRRHYPEDLVPVQVISSVFFLRFFLPYASEVSKESSKISQKIMNAFVFRDIENLDWNVFREIAKFNLEIAQPRPGKLHFDPVDIKVILNFLIQFSPEVVKSIHQAKKKVQPIMWSILEMLEDYFAPDGDIDVLLSSAKIMEN